MAMPDDQIIYADFSRVTISAESVEVVVNPYSQSTVAQRKRCYDLLPAAVRHQPTRIGRARHEGPHTQPTWRAPMVLGSAGRLLPIPVHAIGG